MDVILQIFKQSISMGTPFFESLAKKPSITMDDLFRKVDKYSMLKDDVRVAFQQVLVTNQLAKEKKEKKVKSTRHGIRLQWKVNLLEQTHLLKQGHPKTHPSHHKKGNWEHRWWCHASSYSIGSPRRTCHWLASGDPSFEQQTLLEGLVVSASVGQSPL